MSSEGPRQGCPYGNIAFCAGSYAGLSNQTTTLAAIATDSGVHDGCSCRLSKPPSRMIGFVSRCARGGDLSESKGHLFSRTHSRTELIAAGLLACMVDRGASGMRDLGGAISTLALCEAYVANVLANATTLTHTALETPGAQERTCVIFGVLTTKPTSLIGVVSMIEYPGIAAAWGSLLRVSLSRE